MMRSKNIILISLVVFFFIADILLLFRYASWDSGVDELLPFLGFSAIGSLAWGGVLASLGFFLEDRYTHVADYLDPVTKVIVASVACTYAYRFATFQSRRR